MTRRMEKVRRFLILELCAALIMVVIIVLLYESGWLLPGSMMGNASLFVVEIVMQLITLLFIPLALYLLKLGGVRKSLKRKNTIAATAYCRWSSLRMLMICLPMVLNVLFYYLYGEETSFFYMAVVLLVSLSFIYPSKNRCEEEIHLLGEQKDTNEVERI